MIDASTALALRNATIEGLTSVMLGEDAQVWARRPGGWIREDDERTQASWADIFKALYQTRATSKTPDAVALVLKHEWHVGNGPSEGPRCIECRGFKRDGHAEGCEVARIKAAVSG